MNAFKHYFALEKKLRNSGMKLERSELIHGFTGGRTESLRDLTAAEYEQLIRQMNNMVHKQHVADNLNTMRRKVIALLCKCGYVTAHQTADMSRINTWCVTHGHRHKPLNEYNGVELPKLITQAELMYTKFLNEL